jgi:hypothetical protein
MTYRIPSRHPSAFVRASISGSLAGLVIIGGLIFANAIGIFNTCTSAERLATRSPATALKASNISERYGLRAAADPFKHHPSENP